MSEKRIIDFKDLIRLINDSWNAELSVLFRALPKPTLLDVCGDRTLGSMTEDEIRELVELYAGSSVYIKLALRDNDKSIYVEYMECSKRKTMHIYLGELSVGGKEVKIFKWFIENSFNVFGETK